MLGFVRWVFKDCYKQVQFWAFSIVMFSLVMQFGGCPAPWPWRVLLVGVAVSIIDTLVRLGMIQYDMYKREQDQIARELSRK